MNDDAEEHECSSSARRRPPTAGPNGESEAAASMQDHVRAFLDHCRIEKGLSANSLDAYELALSPFSIRQ